MNHNQIKDLEIGNNDLKKLISGKDFSIEHLRINEMNILTQKRLMPSNLYRIELISLSNEKIKPTAVVMNSLLKGMQNETDNKTPLYEVSLKFVKITEHEITFLKNLISELVHKTKHSQ